MSNELPKNINIGESPGESPSDKTIAKPAGENLPKEDSTGDITEYRKELKVIKNEAVKTNRTIERIENITYLGLIIIIFMVLGLVFGYIEFVYSGSKNDDYKYNLSQQVNNQENEINMLKLCLKAGGWNKCF